MVREKERSAVKQAVIIIIRHTGEWDPARHALSFLRPLIEGESRRLTTLPPQPPGSGPPPG
ncbi:hypothetical protein [Anaeroselena agilis]|uniref:Uncharacterized protein n=1 Tax=Anaeroselena agilis TaxID=3063788 RepID=A0ABU3NYA5_9FIRM|nr:hypothetical protein [Selenomonadales bacterium 4137-cl]